jgi:hypothetical protein
MQPQQPRGLRTQVALTVDWDFFFDYHDPRGFPYDWGHQETTFHQTTMWQVRPLGDPEIVERLTPHPMYQTFWEDLAARGVRFAPKTRLVVGDSHAHALEICQEYPFVVSFDNHHDLFYSGEDERRVGATATRLRKGAPRPEDESTRYEAGSWLGTLALLQGAIVGVVYPEWGIELVGGKPAALVAKRKLLQCHGAGLTMTVWPQIPGWLSADAYQHPVEVTAVYIARSGAWTPPWADRQFEHFIQLTCAATGVGVEERLPDLTTRAYDPDALQAAIREYEAQVEQFQRGAGVRSPTATDE